MRRTEIKFAVLLAVLICLSLLFAACNEQNETPTEKPEITGSSDSTAGVPEDKTPEISDATPEQSADNVPTEQNTDAAATDQPTEQPTDQPTTNPTPVPTPPPDQDQDAAKRALEFEKTYEGTWTANDDSFLDFSLEDGEPWIFNAIWNSGGEFPSFKILDAVKLDESGKKLLLKLRSRDGAESELNFESQGMYIDISTPGGLLGGKRYFYDGTRQYPPETQTLTKDMILGIFGGKWVAYQNSDDVILIEKDSNGDIKLTRLAGGSSINADAYTIKTVTTADALGHEYEAVFENRNTGKDFNTTMGVFQAGGVIEIDYQNGKGRIAYLVYNAPTLENVDPFDFVDKFNGEWTNSDDEFISYSSYGGTPGMMFAIWNAGGPFPAGEILKVTRIGGEDYYEVLLKMNDDSGTHTFFVKYDSSTGKMTVWEDGEDGKDYYYDAMKQQAKPMTVKEILSYFGGVWIADINDNEFIQIETAGDESVASVIHGFRNDIGAFDYYSIDVAIGDALGKDFQLTLRNSGTDEISVHYAGLIQAGQTLLIDLNDGKGERAFVLSDAKRIVQLMPTFLANQLAGSWTASNDSDFIDIDVEDEKAVMMFAVWYSGGQFPAGRIMRVTQISGGARDGEYLLVLRMNGTNSIESYGLKKTADNKFEFWPLGGKHDVYTYYPDKQLP